MYGVCFFHRTQKMRKKDKEKQEKKKKEGDNTMQINQ